MKKYLFICIVLMVLLCACAPAAPSAPPSAPAVPSPSAISGANPSPSPTAAPTPSPTPTPAPKEMSITSDGITNGVIGEEFGAHGSQKKSGIPTLSLPVSITDTPEGTACVAITMLDPDSVPLCGYEWVHWLAISTDILDLPSNASIDLADTLIQGKNDFNAPGYGGPTPPDKPHTYVITVYALDASPNLTDGFSKDDLLSSIEGHVLATATLQGQYSN